MKILIVTRYFYPEITPRSFRAFELAKEFSRRNHDVSVLTTKRSFHFKDLEKKYKFKVMDIVTQEPVELGGGIVQRFLQIALNRIFLYPHIFLWKSFKDSLVGFNGFDMIISIAQPYPVHFAVAQSRKKNAQLCKKWIADCGDPFFGDRESRIPLPFYFSYLENWFTRQPDYISVPVESALEAFPPEVRPKIRIIPQGFDFAIGNLDQLYKPSKYVKFAYAGLINSTTRDPRPLLKYLAPKKIDFRFFIYTKRRDIFQKWEEVLGNRIVLRDYIPRDALIKELANMDFLIDFRNRSSVQIPSKLIDYGISSRPILSIDAKEFSRSKVDRFLMGDYRERLETPDLENYNIQKVVDDFESLGE